ncbi:protein patched homolog 1-like [Rhopilema esculentum]|uniref:protein patched homolog 1-like n=1 Tax=Rhopilema esculentum TaxID=499914 RepID=UPI0031D23A2B
MEPHESNSDRKNYSILQACSQCNVISAKVRGNINHFLYKLGCWIQGKSLTLFLIGITTLLGLCVGLKQTNIETDIEKLWVDQSGRLSQELNYLKKYLKDDGIDSEHEVMIQVAKDHGSNILNVEAMKEHLEMMKRVVTMGVYVHQDLWKLEDICIKPSLGTIADGSNHLVKMLEHMTPCLLMTPLDCFYEGSQIAGPLEPAIVPVLGIDRKETWETLDPYGIIDELVRANVSGIPEVELKKLFAKTGIESGYLKKPCLDPQSPKCPATSVNYRSRQPPDIGEILTGGCRGYATKLMNWPEELLVGGRKMNKSQILRSGKGLQSVLMLESANDLYSSQITDKGMSIPQWSVEKADQVIKAWQREFTRLVNKNGFKNSSLTTDIMAYSPTSFYDLIKKFSQPDLTKIITGYLVMLAYAFITLKRWSNAVYSYGAVGVVGVILVSSSVAAAMGLSSLLKVSFNAASTQVLPFLALGLGVDDMFLVARTYVSICEAKEFEEHEIVGETLRNCGLSVTLTSFTNVCAFFMASLIPVPALQAFSRQASLIVAVNWVTIMFLFTSTLGFDVKRVQSEKYDLFCCSGREVRTPPMPTIRSSNILQDIAFLNLEGLPGASSIYAGASLNALVAGQQQQQQQGRGRGNRGAHRSTRDGRHSQNRQSEQESQTEASRQDTVEKRFTLQNVVQHISLSYFAENYFGPFLQHMTTKIFVIFMLAIFLGVCAYGAFQVKDGLSVAEMIPRHNVEYSFVTARFQYFSFYQMHIVTKESFDYANNQQMLYSFHRSFAKIDEVVRDSNGNLPKFWLMHFRDWLIGLQNAFDAEWKENRLNRDGWAVNASREAILGYKLIGLSCNSANQRNLSRIPHGRMVNANGIIYPKCFYHYLTSWFNEDSMVDWMSHGHLKPTPPDGYRSYRQTTLSSSSLFVPKANPLKLTLMPFYLNDIRTTEDFFRIIKVVRKHCQEFADKGLPNFPTGMPFVYWEQYIYLHGYLWLAVGIVLASTLIVLAIALMNLWAALLLVAVLVMNTFELYGVMGLLSLKLSAVPAITLIMSVGVGVEFTVHICLAFLNSKGDRNERTQKTLNKMFAPVFDGAVSTLIGVIVLAGSEFEFVVRYFFHLILAMIVIGLANGLVLLPVLLSFVGPCCEVTHRTVQPSRFNDDLEANGRESSISRSRGSGDIELSTLGGQPVFLSAKSKQHGTQATSRGWHKNTNSPSAGRSNNRTGKSKQRYRNPFGASRRCKYQHKNCVYDHRLRKCREQLTPVAEVSTPDSSSRGPSSSASTNSKRSRPGTPITVPGSAKRVESPDYYGDHDDCYIDNDGLPGFIPESENNVTTLKATAMVTLELTSSSNSQPYRVTRVHTQAE